MAYESIVYPVTLYRGQVNEWYVFLPDTNGNPQDFTGVTLSAIVKDKPGGTTLATPTVTSDVAPSGLYASAGWIQMRVDNSVTIPSGYYRGTWTLTASLDTDNPSVIAAGPVEIVSLA